MFRMGYSTRKVRPMRLARAASRIRTAYDRPSAGARVARQRGFTGRILRALAALHHTRRYDHPSGRPPCWANHAICEAYGENELGPRRFRAAGAATLQAKRLSSTPSSCRPRKWTRALSPEPVSVSPSIEGVVVGLPEGKADWDKPKVRVVSSGTDVVEAGSVLDMAHFPGSIAARG